MGEAKVIGQRGEPAFSGKWALTSTSQRGPRTRILTIIEDKAGTLQFRDREIPLKDLVVTGGQLSFTTEWSSGERSWRTTYRGTLVEDVLVGESTSQQGQREFTARQLAGKALAAANRAGGQLETGPVEPVRTEIITPIRNETLNKNGDCPERKQGGNPREVAGYLVFDGSMDGNRQVDPQIAVGGGYVLHGTNHGIIIYDKKGNYVQGVPQSGFNGGIDPKALLRPAQPGLRFRSLEPVGRGKSKSRSTSRSPRPVTRPGPGIPIRSPRPAAATAAASASAGSGSATRFPGGAEQTFVMKMAEAKAGKPATVYHFAGSLGHPVATQDDIDDLYFFQLTRQPASLSGGSPTEGTERPVHRGRQLNRARPGSRRLPAPVPAEGHRPEDRSGDRNPKNLVLQGGYIWFSQAVNYDGRSAVQWHQVTARRHHRADRPAQPSRVELHPDHHRGEQEPGRARSASRKPVPSMFISPRLAFRYAADPKGTLRKIVAFGEGQGATDGTSWGDYSGSTVDGDNHLDLWTIQSITDAGGKGDTIIAKVPFVDSGVLLEQ